MPSTTTGWLWAPVAVGTANAHFNLRRLTFCGVIVVSRQRTATPPSRIPSGSHRPWPHPPSEPARSPRAPRAGNETRSGGLHPSSLEVMVVRMARAPRFAEVPCRCRSGHLHLSMKVPLLVRVGRIVVLLARPVAPGPA